LKVALVIHHYGPRSGGAESWTDRHARMLLADGHEVHLVAATINGAPRGALRHVLDGRGVDQRTFADNAAQLLDTLDVDVVHDMGHGWRADVFMPHHGTQRAVYEQKSKLLVPPERWLRPMAYHCLPRYVRFKRRERRQYQIADNKHFIAVSDMVRRQMIKYHRVPDERIRVVYNGVDVQHFRPALSTEDTAARQRLREELSLGDETVFLFVSYDFDLKGLWTALRSLRDLISEGERAALMVVGPGSMKGKKIWGLPVGRAIDRYPRLARNWDCLEAVRFAGLQDNPAPFYQAADVYLQPTLYDACSLVVLEAMACGLPVITSGRNGVSELIRDGAEGLVVADPQDVRGVTTAMRHFMDPARRRAAGRVARRLAERHSARINFDQVMALYDHLLDRRTDTAPSPAHAAMAHAAT
jgi:UDP-glucose:(heptosyl)LPS alpha-1,3-glucosyltransferase